MDLTSFRTAVDDWLDEHERELVPEYTGRGSLDQHVAHLARVKRRCYDAG